MRPKTNQAKRPACQAFARAAGVLAALAACGQVPAALAQQPAAGAWRIGATTGVYAPRSAMIIAADGLNTRLGAAPSAGLELQYQASRSIAIYGNGNFSFSTISLGSSIQPSVVGPSNQVLLVGGTAGVQFTIPTSGRVGAHLQPTIRIGGGFKWYSFDLTGAQDQLRPTADVGVGFRGVGTGPLEVTAEVRYLPSAFDQAKLPIRGIAPQKQRQNDLVLAVGVAIRP